MANTQYMSPLRFHGLDTLRAIAILFVMLYHLNLQGLLPPALDPIATVGWVGVDLFFVLSGFLIGTQLLRPYLNGTPPSLRDFYTRRAYRILPAFLGVLALYYAVPIWREARGPRAAWQYLSFTWNFFLVGYPDQRAFSHVWSLCVEEHFYLLMPILLLLFMRRPSIWKTGVFFTTIVLGGIALRGWLLHYVVLAPSIAEDQRWILLMKYIYYPTYTRLDGLTTGVGLALIRTFRPLWWEKVTLHGNVLLACGLAISLAAMRLTGYDFPNPALPASVLFSFPMLALGFGLLVASAVCDRSVLKVKIPGASSFATLAFSLYLTHKSVAHAVHRILPSLTATANLQAAGIYATSCLLFATLLYLGIERPFLRLRTRQAQTKHSLLVEHEARLDPAL